MTPPTMFNGVNLQAVARDATERTIQLQAWAEWWSAHPPTSGSERFSRNLMLSELRRLGPQVPG